MSRWIVSDGDGSYKPARLKTTRLFSSRVVTNGALCNKNVRDVYASLFKSGIGMLHMNLPRSLRALAPKMFPRTDFFKTCRAER